MKSGVGMTVNESLVLTSNYSSRGGSPILKFVIHTTQGWENSPNGMYDCAHYFQGNVSASAHYMNDNYHPNLVVAGVYEQYSAWTQGGMNPWCISLEQCALAEWTRAYWLNSRGTLLHCTAALVRQVCDANHLPIRALSASEAQDSWTKGVCQHRDFGSKGGGHSDCGDGYPIDKIIEWALAGSGSQPAGESSGDMTVAVATHNNQDYYAGLWEDGKVNFLEPGGRWFAVDPKQSGAKSGCGLSIHPNGRVVISYTNGNGAACIYQRDASGGPFSWLSLSPDNSFR